MASFVTCGDGEGTAGQRAEQSTFKAESEPAFAGQLAQPCTQKRCRTNGRRGTAHRLGRSVLLNLRLQEDVPRV